MRDPTTGATLQQIVLCDSPHDRAAAFKAKAAGPREAEFSVPLGRGRVASCVHTRWCEAGGEAYGVVTVGAAANGRTESGVSLADLDARLTRTGGTAPDETEDEAGEASCAAALRAALAPLNPASKWWETPLQPQLVLGPVVGQVTESSAIILLEIDRAATCELTLRDALTGEEIRARCAAPANRPFSLVLKPLRSARRYRIYLEGVTQPVSLAAPRLTNTRWISRANPWSGERGEGGARIRSAGRRSALPRRVHDTRACPDRVLGLVRE